MTDLLSPFATPGDALAAQAEARPDQPALVFPQSGKQLTFGEWHAQATALARALLTAGLGPGDPIGLLAENRIEWPVVQLGVAMIGGVLVPLNTHYREEELGYALENAGVRWLFLSEAYRNSRYLEMVTSLRPRLRELEVAVALDPVGGLLALDDLIETGSGSDVAPPEIDPWAVGSLQYTSGTTGFPKGALLKHHGMMANAWGTSGRLKVTPADRWLTFIPLFHCAGCIMTIMGCLQRGAAYFGVPGFDPVEMFRIVGRGALHHDFGCADLLHRHARTPGTGDLRPYLPARRHLRRRGHRPGHAEGLRGSLPGAGRRAGLRPDRGEHLDQPCRL